MTEFLPSLLLPRGLSPPRPLRLRFLLTGENDSRNTLGEQVGISEARWGLLHG